MTENSTPESKTPNHLVGSQSLDTLTRYERRLKVIDFMALLALGFSAILVTDARQNWKPAFLIVLGAYQIIMSCCLLALALRRKKLGSSGEETLPACVPLDTAADARLRRWRRVSRRLPYQLDYILRAVLGFALTIWGAWLMWAG